MSQFDRPAVDQLRRLSAVLPLLVNAIFFATGALVLLGPRPSRAHTDADITLPYLLVREPTDRWILLAWWAAACSVLLLVWAPRVRRTSQLFTIALQALAPILLLLAVFAEHDSTGLFAEGTWRRPVLGSALAVALLALARVTERRFVSALRWLVTVVFVFAAVASFAMAPLGLRDADSFRYTTDELLAPAVGAVPYANFAPQYSALLGYPISFTARLMPSHSIQVVLVAVLLMQIATIISALWLVRSVISRPLLPLAAAVLLSPVILTSPGGYSAGSYHANLPLRMFLPTMLIAYAYRVLRHSSEQRFLRWQDQLGLGVLAGACALNNPEYGAPAMVALLVVLAAMPAAARARLQHVGVLLLGAAASAIGFVALLALAGHPPRMQSILVFQRIFGAEGFFAWPIPASGLAVMFVAAFASAAIVGITIVRRGGASFAPPLFDASLQLALVGIWATLSLPYYVGRSLTPTLLGGFGLQLGWVLAASFPLLAALRAGLRQQRGWILSTFSVVGIMVAVALGMASTVAPNTYLKAATAGGTAPSALLKRADQLRALHVSSDVDQLLDMPASTALLSGVPSHAIVSSPAYLRLSRNLAALQCEQGWPSSTHQVILDHSTLLRLQQVPACVSRLALEGATRLPVNQDWWQVPFRLPPTS